MNSTHPIFTEKNDCKDCYKCVRWCPVKSIKVEKDSASILDDYCIHCGRCVLICPSNAKQVRNDIDKAQALLRGNEQVVVSIAPSYLADFNGIAPSQMIQALQALGFNKISETALGAEMVSTKCRDLLNEQGASFYISSACPSVVELIQKYYPEYNSNVTPLLSPMASHGKFLRQFIHEDIRIVFFGPCIAKKVETDKEDTTIDVALTFKDLNKWFEQENINPFEFPVNEELSFFPENAASASMYPVDGGMVNSIKDGVGFTDNTFMSFSGIGNIKKVLKSIDEFKTEKPVFLELLACEGGCINGPGTISNHSLAKKRYALLSNTPKAPFKSANNYNIAIDYNYGGLKNMTKTYSQTEISEILKSFGKYTEKDELNCGGCGYDSCKEFAQACIDKKAEQNMCVSYMRRIAQDKATALLQKIPSGVVMVNEDLKVIESNKSFSKLLGEDIEMIYEINPGLEGADLKKLVSFHKLFSSVLKSGKDIVEKDIRENNRLMHASIFTIQKHRVVCGLFRDMYAPEVRRDEVIRRTKTVIKENLSTVQQIAFLLGENASKTEAMLHSIVDSYDSENEE